MPTRTIPLAQPSIGARERQLVEEVLSSGVLALGPFARDFEERIASLTGRLYGIACSSGTAALHMIVRALGLGEGDDVITTPFSFVASANCLMYERVRPRFVDIEDEALGLDPGVVEDAANRATNQAASDTPPAGDGPPGNPTTAAALHVWSNLAWCLSSTFLAHDTAL